MRKTRNFAAKYGAAPPRLRSGRWPATELRVGISGWTYRPWRGVFYPKGLAQNRELEFASRAYNSIEINGSFYSLQRPSSYEHWYAETPPGFIFSVKGPRFITHMKKLRDVETPLANFFGSGVLAAREAWTGAMAISAELWVKRRTFPAVLRAAAARYRCGGCACQRS